MKILVRSNSLFHALLVFQSLNRECSAKRAARVACGGLRAKLECERALLEQPDLKVRLCFQAPAGSG